MPAGESKIVSGGRVIAINLAETHRAGQEILRDGQRFIVKGDGLTAVLRSIAVNPSQSVRVIAVSPWITVALVAGLLIMWWRSERA